jgi:hypothetical protein
MQFRGRLARKVVPDPLDGQADVVRIQARGLSNTFKIKKRRALLPRLLFIRRPRIISSNDNVDFQATTMLIFKR